jgi:hypothetical protein
LAVACEARAVGLSVSGSVVGIENRLCKSKEGVLFQEMKLLRGFTGPAERAPAHCLFQAQGQVAQSRDIVHSPDAPVSANMPTYAFGLFLLSPKRLTMATKQLTQTGKLLWGTRALLLAFK